MPVNMFSPLLNEDVSRFRRVGHSAKNYLQTVHVNPFGDHSSINLDNLSNVGGQAMNVMGVVAGSAAIGFATGAVATGAFAAAVAGPQAAVTLGVIAVAMSLKSAYSNREASHKALSPFVHNMVDDVAPPQWTKEGLKKAAQAANYLLSEGQNQFELVSSKYQAAATSFRAYLVKLDAKVTAFNIAKAALDAHLRTPATTPTLRQSHAAQRVNLSNQIIKIKKEAAAEYETAMQSGGAIFEFVRRCSHTGNYLQAPHIMHLAIMEELKSGEVTGPSQRHQGGFNRAEIVTTSRTMFSELDAKFRANRGADKLFA